MVDDVMDRNQLQELGKFMQSKSAENVPPVNAEPQLPVSPEVQGVRSEDQ